MILATAKRGAYSGISRQFSSIGYWPALEIPIHRRLKQLVADQAVDMQMLK